jgi:hypothetical protein
MASFRISLTIILVVFALVAVNPARAQMPFSEPAATGTPAIAPCAPLAYPGPPDGSVRIVNLQLDPGYPPEAQPNTWVGAGTNCESPPPSATNWFGGADFLYVRPHFSEATAYARGTEGASSLNVTAQALEFDYQPAFRVFAGYRFDGTDTELQFTYTRMTGQTEAGTANLSPGHFVVDPFGNVVGDVVVVDPNSALFGQQIVGGDRIQVNATVDVNIFDFDLIKPLVLSCGPWELKYTVGVRLVDIDQSYQSVISDSGAFFSGGQYTANYVGAGPRVGFQALRYFGWQRQFSLFANASGSLLVGQYEMRFSQTTTAPPFQASQDTDEIRVIPVAETEIGAGWSPFPWMNVSAGWLFQAWFDLGASGGTFGGFYTVTENTNLMAFEGLFVRAEVTF